MAQRFRVTADYAALREEVATRAAAQAHVFGRGDLVRWGIHPDLCPTMVKRGLWVRLRHGVYTDAAMFNPIATDPHARHGIDVAAAVVVLHHPAYAFGISAAHLHDLPLPGQHAHDVHLLRQTGVDQRALHDRMIRTKGLPAVRLTGHRLENIETTTIADLPVVARPLAALSAAAALTHEWAVAVMDAACFEHPELVDALSEMVEEWPLLLGIGTVPRALPHVRSGAQSPFESISRVRLVRHGLPEPELQKAFSDDDGLIGYADMWWPELGVIGEADGAMKYDGLGRLLAEKRREDRLRAAGYAVARWQWSEIMTRPHAVAAKIQAAARWSRRRGGRDAG